MFLLSHNSKCEENLLKGICIFLSFISSGILNESFRPMKFKETHFRGLQSLLQSNTKDDLQESPLLYNHSMRILPFLILSLSEPQHCISNPIEDVPLPWRLQDRKCHIYKDCNEIYIFVKQPELFILKWWLTFGPNVGNGLTSNSGIKSNRPR